MDRLRGAVNPHPVLLLDSGRQFQHDRAVGQKEDRSVTPGITTQGDCIQRNRGVLVHPQYGPVGQDRLHSRLSSGIQPISGHQRHVDDGFQCFLAPGRKDRGVPFEVGYVAQRGRIVLNRGHPQQWGHQGKNNGEACQEVAIHGDLLSDQRVLQGTFQERSIIPNPRFGSDSNPPELLGNVDFWVFIGDGYRVGAPRRLED